MDYEQRTRLRARLQRCGEPAILDELIRLGEAVDLLQAQVETLRNGSADGPAVVRRVVVDFGHGWQIVEDGPCSGLGGCECAADDDGDEHENGLWRSQIVAALADSA